MSVTKLKATPNDRKALETLLLDKTPPSLQSIGFNAFLRLLPFRKLLESSEAVQRHVRQLALKPAPYGPKGLEEGINVSLKNKCGWPVYYLSPTANPNAEHHVVFLHGGGYINEIVEPHWRFVAGITRKANVRCIVPIYPLAPGANASHTVPTTGEILRQLFEDVGAENVTVIGNSAGGGLALASAQWLRDAGYPQANRLVLISPALNAAANRPEQIEIATRDPLQDLPGIIEAGRLYAGELDTAHPYVSPLNGNMQDLAPMLVFAGTRDLFYPDSIDLFEKAQTAGVPVQLHFQREQPHNYPLMPTPEGKLARLHILNFIRKNTNT